ncbi:MAG: DNA repair protein RadA [Dehalococcoidia bacterium]|nr:DNA repair protein RadA [Dehalococcoidia bacterium]MDW8120266.1 DNA repair protein RadA [Chloroflexota bacterium]
MPPKERRLYSCVHCGWESPQWLGFCRACGVQEPLVEASPSTPPPWVTAGGAPIELAHVEGEGAPRLPLPLPEVNRVLGGGIVAGSIILLAGEPGIGKSTLLLQIASALAAQGRVVYLAGEESPQQIASRARRMGIPGQGIILISDTCLDTLGSHLDTLSPRLLIVDSIQTVFTQEAEGFPGSIVQVRECTRRFLHWAKPRGVPVLLVGHVTKEGDVAGPQVLQHMVDAVLFLEGERRTALRLLRADKNRFGSTQEVAVLEMTAQGLREVADPSRYLLEGRSLAPGSAVAPLLVGDRPLLVEVQALTSPASGSSPRRDAVGYDERRLRSIVATLSQRAHFPISDQDITVKVVGGLRVDDPAADLAVALAIASSARDTALDPHTVFLGEVGLTGELRGVPQTERRLREAARLGFTSALVPPGEGGAVPEMTVHRVRTLRQALALAIPPKKRDPVDPLVALFRKDAEAMRIARNALALEERTPRGWLGFEWYEVEARKETLEKLVGTLVEVTLKTNSSTYYRLKDPEAVRRALKKMENPIQPEAHFSYGEGADYVEGAHSGDGG